MDAVPHGYGDNFPNGEVSDFTVREIVDPYHANSISPAPAASKGRVNLTINPGAIVTLTNVPLRQLPADFQVLTN